MRKTTDFQKPQFQNSGNIYSAQLQPYVGKTKFPWKIYITQVDKIENLNQQPTFLYFLESKNYAFSALPTGIGMWPICW